MVYDVLDFVFNYYACAKAEKTKYRLQIRERSKGNTKAASRVSRVKPGIRLADTWQEGGIPT